MKNRRKTFACLGAIGALTRGVMPGQTDVVTSNDMRAAKSATGALDTVSTRMSFPTAPTDTWRALMFYEQVDARPPLLLRALRPVPIRTSCGRSQPPACCASERTPQRGWSKQMKAMITRAVSLGVCKFNVNTELRKACLSASKAYLSTAEKPELVARMQAEILAMQTPVRAKLVLFGSVGKAD